MRLAGRVVIEEFECEALRDNPLGDPARREIPVYLPPGYDRSGRRYPVIYWLHGVTGKSSGGYGALVVAMRNPQLFGAVASHSGDMYFEACYQPFFWKDLDHMRKHGGLDGFLKAFREAPKKPDDMMHAAMNSVAMAMAYSPNPESPYGFDPVVDPETGELIESVWARWQEWDPVRMVERYTENLHSMRLIYFECGTRDQYYLLYGTRILHRRLGQLGIRHEYQEFDDDHTAVNYRYVESLRRLCNVLKA